VTTGIPTGDETESLIAKGRFKEAVKQAKLCYKEDNTAENHRLLERAYFLRAQQLLQLGMRASAIEVAGHLLEFGVTASDWAEECIRLLMNLGLAQEAVAVQGQVGAPELQDQLVVMAADLAVIHPDRADAIPAEVRSHAALIRQALLRLEKKDDAGAVSLLRDLGRGSVLSEWKFFVRGLAAFYRHDQPDMKANWDRLDPKRKAFLIARRLLALADAGSGNSRGSNTDELERLAYGEPVLDRLRELRGLTATKEWDKVIRLLGPLRLSLTRIDQRLAGRLTGALIGSVIKETDNLDFGDMQRLVTGFTGATQPMAFDPNWNRLWAMIWSGERGDDDEALKCWARYVGDLTAVTAFNSSERALAQAMVWNHMAEMHRDRAADLADPEGPFGLPSSGRSQSKNDSREVKRAKKQVIDCLEKSLHIAPAHLPTYTMLVEVYRGWEDRANLEAAAQRLLAKFPDNLETLTLLAREYFAKNDAAAALALVQKARAIKPLDESLRELEWNIRIRLARVFALSRSWELGRKQFTAAEELLPSACSRYDYLARKVIFEAKASERERSDRFLEQARAGLDDPTALWLALLIESIRYEMTKATQKGYAQLWESALKSKCTSEAAGEMAALLREFVVSRTEYPGRAGHIKKVVSYLQRTKRLKYRCGDIEQVCEFLGLVEGSATLLEKLVTEGVRKHPGSVLLNYRAGLLAVEDGPLSFDNFRAQDYLQTAVRLAEASNDPNAAALLPQIKSALTLLKEMSSGQRGFPFGSPGDSFFDLFDDFEDDEDDLDDDDFGPSLPPGPRAPGKAANKPPRQKR
jgi:hypothetical protein